MAGTAGGMDVTARSRENEIVAFLDRAGWGGALRRPLAGDASSRRYERVRRGREAAILMDAQEGGIASFLAVGDHLAGLGLSAPARFAADPARGLLLLEDLGDSSFTRLLRDGTVPETTLYFAAVDLLAVLRGVRRPGDKWGYRVPDYDEAAFLAGPSLILDWHVPALGLELAPGAREAFVDIWRRLWTALPRETPTLMLRDFHIDNLHWLEGRQGLARVGLLDFQDASMGPPSYDLVSLIGDVRRDVSPSLAAACRDRYAHAVEGREPGFDRAAFDLSCAIMGAQRCSRIAGVFVRLCRRDGKPRYLDFLPRVWANLEADLRHPVLAGLRDWYDRYLPGPAARAGVARIAA